MSEPEPHYDAWHYIGYAIAVAIMVPIGIWLSQSGIVRDLLAPFFSYY